MAQSITLPYNLDFRKYQRDVWNAYFLDNYKKFMLLWHRRAGKDDLCINLACAAAMETPMYVLYLLPEQKQARKVIWHGVRNDGKPFKERIPKQLIRKESSVEMTIELINGSVIQLAGSDNYNSLMGTNPKLIIHSEYAMSNPFARQYLRPILVQNGGAELIISTPRGMNHMFRDYNAAIANPESWYCSRLTVDDTYNYDGTPVTSPALLESERKDGSPEEVIQSEYYCSFEAAVLGAYYAKELRMAYNEKRIGEYPIDPSLPTITMWDLGFSDHTAIWVCQIKDGGMRFVKYYANYGQTFEHYARWIKDFSVANKLSYHAHIAPHDINVTELFGTNKTRLEKARDYGIIFQTVPRTRDVTEEIGEVRDWFGQMTFDSHGCAEGLACLSEYHAEYNIENNIYSSKPKHNWASHGADSLRTGIMWYSHQKMKPQQETRQVTRLYNPLYQGV